MHNAPKQLKSALKKSSSSSSHLVKSSTLGSSLFPSTKRDKRHIKHAALMSKITKPSSNKARRRRPNKKLVATLDSLAGALPDEDTPGQGSTAGAEAKDQVNIIRRKSMKSRPGAMKRREKIDLGERERFARNMAQMAASTAASNSEESITGQSKGPAAATSQRWAALRGFIAQTLEQKPELKANVQS
jgi:hypothetical protein